MTFDHDRFMKLALEAENVPVGSVMVKDGHVIGKGRNQVNSHSDPTAHAETVAIRDACANLQTPDLSGSTCYTVMEPCPMCCWAILEAGISGLVLGARHAEMKRADYGDYAVEKLLLMTRRKLEIVTGVMVADCEAMRRSWKGWVDP